MRKILLLAFLFVLLGVSTAWAYQWALQVRGFGGALFPMADNWSDLYENAAVGQGGLVVDAELLGGFGPYLVFSGGEAKHVIEDRIEVRFTHADIALGLQYRFFILPWLAPGAHVAPIFSRYYEEIKDDYINYEMEENLFAVEVGQEWNFYPFYAADNFTRGFGAYLAIVYQYRPLDGFGDLTDASGLGFQAGLQYRWDFIKPRATIQSPPPAIYTPPPAQPEPEEAPSPAEPPPAPERK